MIDFINKCMVIKAIKLSIYRYKIDTRKIKIKDKVKGKDR